MDALEERATLGAHDSDLAIVGAGPAGAAAAITAARLGLRVVLFEAARFPRFRPGETLSGDAMALIKHLLGHDDFEQLPKMSHDGVTRLSGDGETAPSGTSGAQGFHIDRERLDAALLRAAINTGVAVKQPVTARRLDLSGRDAAVVVTDGGDIRCRFVIDATGTTQWLTRHLGLHALLLSRPLRVVYQYWQRAAAAPSPTFSLGQGGWRWCSNLPDRKAVTAAMSFDGVPFDPLSLIEPLGPPRHAACTWRIASQLADSRFALAGDAACHTDPASSRGVFRALASGMGAADAAHAWITGRVGGDPLEAYCRSVTHGFLNDCRALNAAYRQASVHQDPVGFERLSNSIFWGGDRHAT